MRLPLIFSIILASLNTAAFASSIKKTMDFNAERVTIGSIGDGWYFVPHIGFNFISNTSTSGYTVDFSNGISLGGGIGLNLGNDLAIQFDAGHIKNDIDHFENETTGESTEPDVQFTQVPLLLNAIWTPSAHVDVRPYFGLGAGAVWGKYSSNDEVGSKADWGLGLRAQLGATIELTTSTAFSFGYQFTLVQYDDDVDNHNIQLGLRIRF